MAQNQGSKGIRGKADGGGGGGGGGETDATPWPVGVQGATEEHDGEHYIEQCNCHKIGLYLMCDGGLSGPGAGSGQANGGSGQAADRGPGKAKSLTSTSQTQLADILGRKSPSLQSNQAPSSTQSMLSSLPDSATSSSVSGSGMWEWFIEG